MNKEPTLIGLIALWIVNRLISLLNIPVPLSPEIIEGLVELVAAIIAALIIRANVFSKSTIREAGLNPAKVERDAKNPSVTKFPG